MMVKVFHAHSVIVFISDFFGLEKPGADALLYLASKILWNNKRDLTLNSFIYN